MPVMEQPMLSETALPPRQRQRLGFTLIEVLVVVSIIAVLIAILIPALNSAKKHARKVEAETFLTAIAQSIEQYERNFNDYPGPFDAVQAGTNVNSGAKVMSGTQSLLLALNYSWTPTSQASPNDPTTLYGTTPTIAVGSSPAYTVVTGKATGPLDHGNTDPNGRFRGAAPLLDLNATNLSPTNSDGKTWPYGGIQGASGGNTFAFPTIMDHYPVPMPILYYRVKPSTSGSVTYNNGTPTGWTLVSSTGTGAIDRTDNAEYIESTGIVTSSGSTASQAQYSPIAAGAVNGGNAAKADLALARLLTTKPASGTGTAYGPTKFVLICAGEDRIYGTADDVIVAK